MPAAARPRIRSVRDGDEENAIDEPVEVAAPDL